MKLGFLGYGNLARALVAGVCRGGAVLPSDVYICANTEATLSYARGQGYNTVSDSFALFDTCDIVVLAIKPKVFREMKLTLSRVRVEGRRVISVMAAVGIEEIGEVLKCPVMRVMPTLAAADGRDILGYSCDPKYFEDVIPALSVLGDALMLSENMLERLTVAASCGLGFAAHVLEAYRLECMSLGFDAEQADAITRRMFGYAAQDAGSFSELEARVATKGGVTESGNQAMDGPLKQAFDAAFDTAGERVGVKRIK